MGCLETADDDVIGVCFDGDCCVDVFNFDDSDVVIEANLRSKSIISAGMELEAEYGISLGRFSSSTKWDTVREHTLGLLRKVCRALYPRKSRRTQIQLGGLPVQETSV